MVWDFFFLLKKYRRFWVRFCGDIFRVRGFFGIVCFLVTIVFSFLFLVIISVFWKFLDYVFLLFEFMRFWGYFFLFGNIEFYVLGFCVRSE